VAFLKRIETDPARSSGRVRVKILDTEAGRFVTYPSGRVRWFGSEAAADDWIAQVTRPRRALERFRPRNFSRRLT